MTTQTPFHDEGSDEGSSQMQMDHYATEAEERWGHTDAFAQSQERVRKMGKEGLREILRESESITAAIAKNMNEGATPHSQEVQELISAHYHWLSHFYEPNKELYSGLADMYVNDPRFHANYEKIHVGLAKFMHDAMRVFIEKP